MKTVFITGAGGFAGSRLLQYLHEHHYDVVAGVRNRARKLLYERQGLKSLVCDVTDPINVARAIASVRPDAVVHLAGVSRPSDASDEPLEAYQAIDSSWANVLDAVRRVAPRAKVVLASACDVYGDAGADGAPLAESTPLHPVTTFGSLKATAESIARTFYRDYHLDITIARPFHYTGPGQSDRFYFAAAARQITEWDGHTDGRVLRLPDLDSKRDLLHVDDVVTAYERLLQDGRPNEAYNICSGEARTCREWIQAMTNGQAGTLQLGDVSDEASGPILSCLCGDNSKLKSELGWEPQRTAEQALQALLADCGAPATVPS